MTSGRPWVASRKRRARMVIDAVVEDIGNTSIHFDFASTTSRNIWPFNGPAKSTCILCQGRVGQIQGLLTFWGVLQLISRQRWQSCTVCTTPWSRLGHHTCCLARDLMLIIPGWFKCNSDKTTAWYLAGITALLPRGMRPSSTINLSCLLQKVFSSSGMQFSAGQPCKIQYIARERTGSPRVASWNETLWLVLVPFECGYPDQLRCSNHSAVPRSFVTIETVYQRCRDPSKPAIQYWAWLIISVRENGPKLKETTVNNFALRHH